MAVHMFRVFIGIGKMSITDLNDRINSWVDSNDAWEGDTVEHVVSKRRDMAGNECHRVEVRFETTHSKDNLLQKVTDKLDNKVSWYRIGYHACDHDEEESSPCSWDAVVDWGDVPSYVPELA